MKTITSVSDFRRELQVHKVQNQSIGFVPTMGALHEGHCSLIKAAKQMNDIVVLSIFVNPLQFGAGEDYDSYPRELTKDKIRADELGVDIIFAPSVQEIYPRSMYSKLRVEKGVQVLCAKNRPGHFDGVATVVLKLFHIVEPNRAYFGLKDAQQVAVIQNMVFDFNVPVEIIACETIREDDGLAVSSRNINLTKEERMQAPLLYDSLQQTKQKLEAGNRSSAVLKDEMKSYLLTHTDASIDYCEIVTFPELEHQDEVSGQIIIAAALQFSNARLIDNLIVHVKGDKDYVSNDDEI
ncbi:pantoate--beta-alanine ligase [Salibacterium salarium]|uniref:pantoate--beta-alanine ligase n=1 Tax=Salibacterium salarium TaxID=284579 RepID=UPI002785D31B|nr:pantoate--beta-alanine ligase [Salibacterium salarium]MDQ0299409.1 pantoate--beta-alanine ligase [Salibacterium salarium]